MRLWIWGLRGFSLKYQALLKLENQGTLVQESHFLISLCIIQVCVNMACTVQWLSGIGRLLVFFSWVPRQNKIRKCQSLVFLSRCVLERREIRKCQSLVFLFNCVVERSNIRFDSSGARPTPPESRTCLVWRKAV